MIVTMFRWFATLFLALVGFLEGHSNELHCLLVWLGMIACDFLVTNNGFHLPGAPSRQISARLWMKYPALHTQDPVAQSLIHRCELQFRCVFESALFRLDRVSDFVSLEFSTYLGSSRVLSDSEAENTCTCGSLTAAVSVTCPLVVEWSFSVRRNDISPDVVCPQV